MDRQARHARHAGGGEAAIRAERHARVAAHGHRHHHPNTTTAITTNATPTTTTPTTVTTPKSPAPTPSASPGLDAQQVWRNTAGNTNFNASASWNGGSGPAPAAGDVAAFTGAAVAQPQLNSNTSISGLYFSGTAASGYTLSRAASQTFTLTANGTTIGAETGDTNAVAIGAENTSGTNTIAVPITLNPASGTSTIFQATGGTLAISGVISDSGLGITKTGGGTLTLSGTNTFTGTLTVQAGTLSIATINNSGANGVLGNNANAVVLGGSGSTGTLEYTGSTASSTKKFTMATGGTGAFQIDTAATTLTLSGVIDGSGGLSKTGAGTLTLSGTNTYGGGTTLTAGTLQGLNSGATNVLQAFGSGALNLNGGTLQLRANGSGNTQTIAVGNNVVVGGTTTINVDHNTANTGSTFSLGTLSIGANTLNVTGADSYALSIGATTLTGAATFNPTTANLSIASATGTNQNLTLDGTSSANTIGAITTGTGTLTKSNSSTWTLSGADTYTGATSITGGTLTQTGTFGNTAITVGTATLNLNAASAVSQNTLTVNNASSVVNENTNNALSGTTALSISNGSVTLSNANNYTGTTTLSGSGTLTLSAAGAINGSAVSITGGTFSESVANALSGSSSLSIATSLTLSQANNYSGGTTISAGTTTLGNASALGTGGLTMSGGTLELNGKSISLANLSGSGGTVQNTANTNTTLTVGSDNSSTVYNGILNDTNGNRTLNLTKVGTGVLTLGGANTNNNSNDTGTTISGGVLRLNNASALSTALLTINGGVLELQNPTSFTRSLGTAFGNVQITGGTSGFSAFGSAATINLNNNASTVQWGSATFNPTTLVLNETTATAALTFQNGIDLNGANRTINVNANTATISGTIINGTGTAGLTKGGLGTLVLGNANTYNGVTNINGGTLNASVAGALGSGATGTSQINVNSGGTLLFSGSSGVTDRVRDSANIVLNSGTFNSNGFTESAMGALTLSATSILDLKTIQAGLTHDILAFANSHLQTWSGTLNIYDWTGTVGQGGGTDQVFVGVDTTGLTAAQLLEINFYSDAGATFLGHAGILANGEICPIPEPSTWVAGALALGAVGYMQRRRLRELVRRAVIS